MKHLSKLFILLMITPAWAAESPFEIFELINQRLSLMEEVAHYKLNHQKPVYDPEREETVLNKTIKKASEAGLSAESTVMFFQVQMDAAKSIQYRYLADWSFFPPSINEPVDLKEVIRPELLRLGNEIITKINNYLEEGGQFSDQMEEEFINSVTVKHLKDEEKKVLYNALQKVLSTQQ